MQSKFINFTWLHSHYIPSTNWSLEGQRHCPILVVTKYSLNLVDLFLYTSSVYKIHFLLHAIKIHFFIYYSCVTYQPKFRMTKTSSNSGNQVFIEFGWFIHINILCIHAIKIYFFIYYIHITYQLKFRRTKTLSNSGNQIFIEFGLFVLINNLCVHALKIYIHNL